MPDVKYPDSHIAVFAREPVLGGVKTRLQSHLSPPRCLALYRAMLARTVTMVRQSALAPYSLWVSSNRSHEDFLNLCNKKSIYVQSGQDLGQRMAHASAALLNDTSAGAVVIIGTDCPALEAGYLRRALQALADGEDVVLGPAEDGGYVLVGLQRPLPALFRDVAWGTDQVLAQTLSRLRELGLRHRLLEPLWDVDRPEDLARLDSLVPPLAF